ncbi:RidA family protein [Daejeonella sp. H1SJ63]|uniref:RidA family protein n=1 Tax=Daejeonella sp. H1SJ63 TaxID=3034145 RepID=UPI0023EC965E|nr:RidA family protein [Daejeonella sp. H1SJ63]
MKRFILITLLFCAIAGSAQEKGAVSGNKKGVQYITSSSGDYSDAVIVDELPLAHTVQFLPIGKTGKIAGSGLREQSSQVFQNLSKALNKSGSGIDKIIKLNVYISSHELKDEAVSLIKERFKSGKVPAISFVAGKLAHEDALICIDAIAVASGYRGREVKYINSDSAEGMADVAIMPAGSAVYVSGQADKGMLSAASRGTLKQLGETLDHLGLKKKDVVQIKSFVNPVTNIAVVEREIADFFKGERIPPLVYVEWLSKDPLVEIELIASSVNTQTDSREQLDFITPPGMTASPVYSKVTRINYGNKIYISGLFGNNPGEAKPEIMDIFNSMDAILKKSGSDFKHLVKATYYVSKDAHSSGLNELRPKFYDPKRPPAASKALVKDVGLRGAGLTIDMIAVLTENK